MNKVILLALLLLLSNNIVKAQNLSFGIHSGILKNASLTEDYSGTPQYLKFSRDKELLHSFNWGIHIGYKLTNHFSLETQLQFIQLRFKETIDLIYHLQNGPITSSSIAEIDWYHNYYYSRIPLLAKYNIFSPISKINLNLIAGPNFGILTQQTSEYRGINDLGIENQNKLNFDEIPLKQFDLGLQFGISVEGKINQSFSTYIEATVYQGIYNIVDKPEKFYNSRATYYQNLNIINRHFSATFGIRYTLLKENK